jgi:hypothetical protein
MPVNIETTVSAAVGGVGAIIGLMQGAVAPPTSPALLALGGGAAGWLISYGMMKATVNGQEKRLDRWESRANERHAETTGQLEVIRSEVGQVRDRVSRIEGQLSAGDG